MEMIKQYEEILKNEYVGDTVEFIDSYGLWHERKLLFNNKIGLHIRHNGELTPIRHWGNDSVMRRVRKR